MNLRRAEPPVRYCGRVFALYWLLALGLLASVMWVAYRRGYKAGYTDALLYADDVLREGQAMADALAQLRGEERGTSDRSTD